MQKVVRLPPGEFSYHLSADPTSSGADVPNFVYVEVVLCRPRPKAEKEAFWAEFHAGVEAQLRSMEPDVLLRFVELPSENLYVSRRCRPK